MSHRAPPSPVQVQQHPGLTAERILYRSFTEGIPRHFHDEYQISACTGGSGTYHYERASARSGTDALQIFPPGMVHAYEHARMDDAGSVYRTFYIDAELMHRLAAEVQDHDRAPDIIPGAVITHPGLRARFERIHESLLHAGADL